MAGSPKVAVSCDVLWDAGKRQADRFVIFSPRHRTLPRQTHIHSRERQTEGCAAQPMAIMRTGLPFREGAFPWDQIAPVPVPG